ncbi:hypothetical protein PR202_gb12165 [Eleusine coracana subsp. coracana]|uniref:Uncharacterized protein n=1 Tax=Eleusine coracana subsp. coracana TaxID=191504 RepID=A0AAV5EPR6_ELECO|nr:hypothetical protein PR202_gb12165 [Eleusine coracana subsp. coracana]
MAPWSGLWGSGSANAAVLAGSGGAYRGTPVVVKMENPSWSISEIEVEEYEEPEEEDEDVSSSHGRERGRRKNAKQITWVLLLKAHRTAGFLARLASAAVALAGAARRRVAAGRTDSDSAPAPRSSPFHAFIKACLALSLLLLAVDLVNGRPLPPAAAAVSFASLHASCSSSCRAPTALSRASDASTFVSSE